eukprot:6500803-Pyramimonas_sp.AAC.1
MRLRAVRSYLFVRSRGRCARRAGATTASAPTSGLPSPTTRRTTGSRSWPASARTGRTTTPCTTTAG